MLLVVGEWEHPSSRKDFNFATPRNGCCTLLRLLFFPLLSDSNVATVARLLFPKRAYSAERGLNIPWAKLGSSLALAFALNEAPLGAVLENMFDDLKANFLRILLITYSSL